MKKRVAIAAIPLAGLAAVAWLMLPSQGAQSGRRSAEIAAGAPIVEVSLPATLSPEAQMGKTFFEAACAACHGENAAGTGGTAPPLVHQYYRSGHHADEAFQRAVQLGVAQHHWSFGNMPPVEGLTRADVAFITRYVRELQAANGIH